MTLLCGALVVANPFTRNPVTSAMFLVLTIVSMAGLFVLLHAFFLAAVQILVYAGAVIVLFLFVIMLLDLKEEERRKINAAVGALALLAVGAMAFVMIRSHPAIRRWRRPGAGPRGRLHHRLWARPSSPAYALPFEVISLLLLVAMIGAVLLSKKDLK